tara:strand:+ start:365 stop:550 length:186 start_codon:yes stop_codon:yes gene_type:complete
MGDIMTRKDYIKVAEILKKASNNIEGENEGTINYIGNDLCRMFIEDNSRFDTDKFWSAVNG